MARLDWRRDSSVFLKPLLDANVPVMAYNGNYDFICNWRSGEIWTKTVDWSGKAAFNAITDYTDAGFGKLKKYQNFAYVVVEQAGHMVPHDQPVNARRMIEWFINGMN